MAKRKDNMEKNYVIKRDFEKTDKNILDVLLEFLELVWSNMQDNLNMQEEKKIDE